jgi:hypothetical protein
MKYISQKIKVDINLIYTHKIQVLSFNTGSQKYSVNKHIKPVHIMNRIYITSHLLMLNGFILYGKHHMKYFQRKITCTQYRQVHSQYIFDM